MVNPAAVVSVNDIVRFDFNGLTVLVVSLHLQLLKIKFLFLVKKHEKREKSYRDEERKHLDEVRAQENNYIKAEAELNQVITKLNEL